MNYFNNLPPQFNNAYNNQNPIINGYKQYTQNNTPFTNNQLLQNNPAYQQSIQNVNFYNQAMMLRMEQVNKIKSINELKMTQEQIVNFVINPIKPEKMSKQELYEKYIDRSQSYITYNKSKKKNLHDIKDAIVSNELLQLWNQRTNAPYKNIIERDNNKSYKTIKDFLVHKVTKLDKDPIKLNKEYKAKKAAIKMHNNEISLIYHASEEAKWKKKFDYVNTFKYRLKHNPKDYIELKTYYKKEQKKLNKANKRIDELIELMLVNDQISNDELNEMKKSHNINDSDDEDDDKKYDKKLFDKAQRKLQSEIDKKNGTKRKSKKSTVSKDTKDTNERDERTDRDKKKSKKSIVLKDTKDIKDTKDTTDRDKKKSKKSTKSIETKDIVGKIDNELLNKYNKNNNLDTTESKIKNKKEKSKRTTKNKSNKDIGKVDNDLLNKYKFN